MQHLKNKSQFKSTKILNHSKKKRKRKKDQKKKEEEQIQQLKVKT